MRCSAIKIVALNITGRKRRKKENENALVETAELSLLQNGVKYCCEDCMKEAAYKRQKERRAAKKNDQKSIEASAIKESDQKGKTA